MTTPLDHDRQLDQHLRRTLHAVAETVQADRAREPAAISHRSRHRRRLWVGTGVAIAAIPLTAAAVVQLGPEYVDRIPPQDPIVSGSIDDSRYWVVDGREIPRCQDSPSGVELIAEEHNIVGREWNTVGAFFGTPTRNGCAPRVAVEPPADTYYSDGGLVVGDAMVWMGALHPDVDQVRVSLGGGAPFDTKTFEHEDGTYYVVEIPPSTATFTIDYLADGELVDPPAGEYSEHVVPDD